MNAEAKNFLHTVDEHGCPTPVDSSGKPYTCRERSSVLTYREQEVMQKILEVKKEAEAVKIRLKALREGAPAQPEAEAALTQRLDELRQLRNRLEREREEAAHERMRLLGHA
ncbi:hypothetical protein [Desulfosoma sp.]|uniref:hypothetical protein n=1 Tax=Desulfosoma sp. TaxID=2603217 RepID=UPI004049123D